MIPFRFVIGRFYSSPAQLNTVLLVDAARWPDNLRTRSVFSPEFKAACQNAYRYLCHRLATSTENTTP